MNIVITILIAMVMIVVVDIEPHWNGTLRRRGTRSVLRKSSFSGGAVS